MRRDLYFLQKLSATELQPTDGLFVVFEDHVRGDPKGLGKVLGPVSRCPDEMLLVLGDAYCAKHPDIPPILRGP